MTSIRVLIWKKNDPAGEPDVEVKIPSAVSRWVPRLMAFVPRKTREEMWGDEVDFQSMFSNIDQLIAEAEAKGLSELAQVKTKDGIVKIVLDKS